MNSLWEPVFEELDMRRATAGGGFTLIELLIVITIILIIAGFSAVKATNALVTAHEASAIASIRAINQAEMIYASNHLEGGYSPELATLGGTPGSGGDQSIDEQLASGRKSGYDFNYAPGEKVEGEIRTYAVTASPQVVGVTGRRRFYSDESGQIRANSSGPADASSPPLQ